jgi:ATP-dependent phosphofructokinase / diphosphate-dependent phosphofructokinase
MPKEGTYLAVEGEVDAFGHARLGGIGDWLAKQIEKNTGYESRAVILGHVQRGGTPTAFDRVLSTRFGIAAIDAVHDGAFGQMVALQCGRIERLPMIDAVGELKLVEPEFYDVAKVFFG